MIKMLSGVRKPPTFIIIIIIDRKIIHQSWPVFDLNPYVTPCIISFFITHGNNEVCSQIMIAISHNSAT